MSRRLPPLNALRVFEAAARHQSFARAAEELHVTPAAVSQQIKALEDYLGVMLFKRGKTLMLSESSSAVLQQVSDAFDQLERAMLKVRVDRVAEPLVLSTPPAFAARWLMPRLDDFHERHPEIELHLLATRRAVDFAIEAVDVAIRFGPGGFRDLLVEPLMQEKIVLVATPAIASTITTATDLTRSNLLEDDCQIKNGEFPDWKTWLSTLGIAQTPLQLRRYSGDSNLAIQAAVNKQPFQIRLSGCMDMQYVEDVAETFTSCLLASFEGAHVFNLAGDVISMDDFIGVLDKVHPGAKELITAKGPQVPVANQMDDSRLRAHVPNLPSTPLEAGIRKSIALFERHRSST